MEEREERNSLKRIIPDWKPIFYPCTQNNIIEFNKKTSPNPQIWRMDV